MKEDELNKKIIEYETTFKKQAETINILNKNQQILVKEVDVLKKAAAASPATPPAKPPKEPEKKEE